MIRTRLARRFWLRKLILAMLLVSAGAVFAHRGFVYYPGQVERAQRYADWISYFEQSQTRELLPGEKARFDLLNREFETHIGPPITMPSRLDEITQIILCALFCGVAFFMLANLLQFGRQRIEFEEDTGTLYLPGKVTIQHQRMKSIEVIGYKDLRLARLDYQGSGSPSDSQSTKLDGWIHDGLNEIIDAIHSRLHPESAADSSAAVGCDVPDGDGESPTTTA